MANYSDIECYEVHNSRVENWDGNNSTANVDLIVDWNKRHALVEDLLLNARPYPFPNAPAPLVAWSASNRNLPDDKQDQVGQTGKYEKEIVSVLYRPANYYNGMIGQIKVDSNGDEIVLVETLEPTAQFEDVDPAYFSMDAEKTVKVSDKYPLGGIRRGMRLTRQMHEVRTLPVGLLTLPGTVNNAAYTSNFLGLTFAAETLMFGEPILTRSIRRDLKPTSFRWSVTLKFDYNPLGWNKIPHPAAAPSGVTGGVIYWVDIVDKIFFRRTGGTPFPEWKPYQPVNYSAFLF